MRRSPPVQTKLVVCGSINRFLLRVLLAEFLEIGEPMSVIRLLGVAGLWALCPLLGIAAQGEMGTGVPQFGLYSTAAVAGGQAVVWGLQNATQPFPTGCTSIILTATTMSADSFKQALSVMMTAQALNKRVRFYAHTQRDSGCGVDYVEMQM